MTRITSTPGAFAGWRSFSDTSNGQTVTGSSRPGPFRGYRESEIRSGRRPGPFHGQVRRCPQRVPVDQRISCAIPRSHASRCRGHMNLSPVAIRVRS